MMKFICLYLLVLIVGPGNVSAAEKLPLEPTRTITFDTDEGTWMSLDMSPDGKTIIFDMLGDLYVLDRTGGKARRLTSGMAFDTQPVFSPDGSKVAFVSDRTGAENIWIMAVDGTDAQQVTFQETDRALFSPEWSADGKYIYASLFRADLHGHGLWRYKADGSGAGEQIFKIKTEKDPQSVTGATPSADGKYLYYAHLSGGLEFDHVVRWVIKRRNLKSGEDSVLVAALPSRLSDPAGGSYFRPVPSPDGRLLAYGVRHDGKTGLRLRDLKSGEDRWLAFPIQQDQLQASHIQDILPRYSFTPDSRSLLLSIEGKIKLLDIRTAVQKPVPFKVDVSVRLGPDLKIDIRQDTGPVQVRLIQGPEQSPDGTKLVFSTLGKIYIMALTPGAVPTLLGAPSLPAYQPSWSPDGKSITYITWTAKEGGHVWRISLDGSGKARRLTQKSGFYTNPVFDPDGTSIYVIRSSQQARLQNYMEYGPLREGDLLKLLLDGSAEDKVYSGMMGGKLHFDKAGKNLYFLTPEGLESLTPGKALQVVGPGWYFMEGSAPVDGLQISPNGKWVLAQSAQQLYVLEVPQTAIDKPLNLSAPLLRHKKITDVGADYFAWADGGRTITWSLGSTYYRRSLDGIIFAEPDDNNPVTAEAFEAIVKLPRATPKGSILLSGATVITMDKAGVLQNADILVKDNRITAIGKKGSFEYPADTKIFDMAGRYIIPGLIDTHHHIADVRREVLDFDAWGPAASLAYGVTTLFDPSTLSIDMMAYSDLVEAGLMTGSRIFSTGPAIFSFNKFKSKAQIRKVLLRYRDHYRLRNLKMYKTGNRRVRQWVAQVSRELGMMPTTEGGLAMKHGLTQVIDGFAGHEHALPTARLYKDVIELMSQSRVGYTLTLMITNGGYEGQDFFIAQNDPQNDPKLNVFWPRSVISGKLNEATWRSPNLYSFSKTAASAAEIMRKGGLVGIGAHGEAPGIGTHWEMQAHNMGGMTPQEVLKAATIGGAEVIGRASELGSITVGKFADLVILEANPLEDIKNTLSIDRVMKDGQLYDGDSLNEVWPRKRPHPTPWFRADVAR